MKFEKYVIIFLVLCLIIFIYASGSSHEPSVIWINLEKKSLYGHLEYSSDISNYMAANKNITSKSHDKFLLQSFQQLLKVYSQNPDPDNKNNPEFGKMSTTNMSVKYSLYPSENHTRFAVQYKAEGCGMHNFSFILNDEQIYNITEKFIENLTTCIAGLISSENADYLFIGSDHGLSLLTLKAAKKLDPKSKIGIIVFDEHVDIYGTKNENNVIGKENVFGKILIEGYADYIVFLEASESAKQWAEYSVDKDFTRYDIFKKIEVHSDKDLMSGKWQAILANSMGNMKKAGITNVMVSLDLDALPTGYTGFEYSIIAPAIASIRFGNNRSEPSFAEIEEGFSKGIEPIEIKNYIRHIRQQASINKIKFGVGNGNTTILGDIQELLPKQDLNNETARATAQIAMFFTR